MLRFFWVWVFVYRSRNPQIPPDFWQLRFPCKKQQESSPEPGCFKPGYLQVLTQKRSFALFCTLLRPFALLRSFALFCARLRSFAEFACYCVWPRLERLRLGTSEFESVLSFGCCQRTTARKTPAISTRKRSCQKFGNPCPTLGPLSLASRILYALVVVEKQHNIAMARFYTQSCSKVGQLLVNSSPTPHPMGSCIGSLLQ